MQIPKDAAAGMRRVLFVHTNFPGQFLHVARALARDDGWEVAAIGGATAKPMQGVHLLRYTLPAPVARADAAAGRFAPDAARGEAAARLAQEMRASGFRPDVVVGHTGWGETMFLRDVFPAARFVSYLEFCFSYEGADVNFDPEFPPHGPSDAERLAFQAGLRARNAAVLLSALESDVLVAPTAWQASRFPADIRGRIRIVHEGVDTLRLAPHEGVRLELPNGRFVESGDEVLTYVARNLEPYRGFHRFMRALPEILRRRPQAQVLVIGGNGVSYGAAPPRGRSWKRLLLEELGDALDLSRVHFLGRVPYDVYIGALQLSRAHVYLTYPFVLSWSMLEAMSCANWLVASSTAPVTEVVRDGETGRLVDFFDPAALADAVCAGLADASRADPMRAAARRRIVETYDLETVCLPAALSLVNDSIT